MKKLKIYAAAVLAVMLLNVPFIFATEHIYVSGTYTTDQPEYKDYNTAGGNGGVFYMYGNSTLNIKNDVVFTNNFAGYHGGVVCLEHKNLTLNIGSNVIFSSNTGKFTGGVIGVNDSEGNNIKINIGNGTIFEKNTSNNGGAISNDMATITIGNNVIFRNNHCDTDGGAIYNFEGNITIGDNVKFLYNSAGRSAAAIYNARLNGNIPNIIIGKNAEFIGNDDYNGDNNDFTVLNNGNMTFKDGAVFKNNYTQNVIVNSQGGILNLIANNNNVEFTGNTSKSNESAAAIYTYGTTDVESVVNLWASNKADIIFNNKIVGYKGGYKSKICINQAIEGYQNNIGTGKIVLNEDMSGYIGTVNFYGGTIELGENGTLFGGDINIDVAKATIAMANDIISDNVFKSVKISDTLTLTVDADLKKGEMDTISSDSFSGDGKITVNKINILSDISDTTEIEFANEILKGKVESVNTASSKFYNYDVVYDPETGFFTFANTGENKTINLGTVASAVAASAGGYATQSVVVNQVFAGMDGKTSNKNQKSANINPSNLYVSASDQVFEDSGKIEKGLWLRPFILNETVKIGDTDVDNNLYGTLAGIDFPLGQDKQLSFYLGYAGSKQEVEEIKANQTGYIVGATGMIIKDSWYAGLTANVIFNKASVDTDFGTDDIDMNMFTIGAKAGYNYNINEKWTLEPNVTIMYGMVSSQSYETSQGAKIDSQSVNNILVDPEVKAKLGLANGWQPYALVGYAANLSSKPTVKAEGVELELDSIDGYVEYGLGVNKDFVGTVWSCYAQVTGRSGGRNGVAGNLGVKYKF